MGKSESDLKEKFFSNCMINEVKLGDLIYLIISSIQYIIFNHGLTPQSNKIQKRGSVTLSNNLAHHLGNQYYLIFKVIKCIVLLKNVLYF